MSTEPPYDPEFAAIRYMCMRHNGELSHLSEHDYFTNLEGIGTTWHGPPPETYDGERA